MLEGGLLCYGPNRRHVRKAGKCSPSPTYPQGPPSIMDLILMTRHSRARAIPATKPTSFREPGYSRDIRSDEPAAVPRLATQIKSSSPPQITARKRCRHIDHLCLGAILFATPLAPRGEWRRHFNSGLYSLRVYSLRVFGRLPGAGARSCTEAGVRKASREETAGEFTRAVVSVYGDLAPVYALIFRCRTGTTGE